MRLKELILGVEALRPFLPSSITRKRLRKNIVMASGMFFLSAGAVAYQDIAGSAPVSLMPDQRWTAHIVNEPIGSAHVAQLAGKDVPAETTLEHKRTLKTLDKPTGKTALPKGKAAKGVRINRSLKGDRVISSTVKRPPAHFSAGSVIRESSLLRGTIDQEPTKLAFQELRKTIQPVRMAQAFYHRKPAAVARPRTLKPKVLLAGVPKRIRGVIQPDSVMLAYAAVDNSSEKPFESLFRGKGQVTKTPVLSRGDHKWAAKRLPRRVTTKSEQRCLAAGIYFEARGEPIRGQEAVAQVILNRVKNPAYPNTICGVVYQNRNWKNRCQFSFACDGIRDRIRSKRHWRMAVEVAKKATSEGIWIKAVGSSTHYHATYVRPRWARTMKRMKRIGRHIFYRTRRGGWS